MEGILIVAEQFHDTLEPLSEWLSNTEKKLANAEPIGTQTSKLQEQIAQHKVRKTTFKSFFLVLLIILILKH